MRPELVGPRSDRLGSVGDQALRDVGMTYRGHELAIQTLDTHLRVGGLLRALGGHAIKMVRDSGSEGVGPEGA